ncbi:MAG: ATP synthase F0 subunit C [Bryobacterales bacterium]|nr:ATP synthase F0 subunit C [Bryobacterales bacterium]
MNLKMVWTLLVLMFVASPMFGADGTNWVAITSGFSMAIASALCAIGQGSAVGKAAEAMARNPAAAGAIRGALILGLVLIESLALYTLVIIFVKVV